MNCIALAEQVSRGSVLFTQLGGHIIIFYRKGVGLWCNDRVELVHLLHSCFHVDAVSLEVQVGFCVKGHTVPDTMRCLFRRASVTSRAEYKRDEVIRCIRFRNAAACKEGLGFNCSWWPRTFRTVLDRSGERRLTRCFARDLVANKTRAGGKRCWDIVWHL